MSMSRRRLPGILPSAPAELGFPCRFADRQFNGGIDLAGTMVEHSLAKPGKRQVREISK
jgi:hypothetical protein